MTRVNVVQLEAPSVSDTYNSSSGTLYQPEKIALLANGSAARSCADKMYMKTNSSNCENCPWVCSRAKLVVTADVPIGSKTKGTASLSIT